MIDRINLILRAKNITAKQFAEEIGIQPSGMSHILSGRNNPSLDFVTKVVRRYPEIDTNWLLLGKGEMYAGGGIMKNEELRMKNESMSRASEPTLFAMEEAMAGGTPVGQEVVGAGGTPAVQDGGAGETPAVQKEEVPQPMAVEAPVAGGTPAVQEVAGGMLAVHHAGGTPAVQEGRRLVKILMIYDDNTFETLEPMKR